MRYLRRPLLVSLISRAYPCRGRDLCNNAPVMRVTPSLFNTTAELDRLVAAIQTERKLFSQEPV